jgi:hypothetical protein
MLWFHSVTVGGSVLRNKLHNVWKLVNYFFKIKLSKVFSNFTQSFDEKEVIFVKQNGQIHKNKM